MTNFFGYQIQKEKTATALDGDRFRTRTLSADKQAELDRERATENALEKKKELPRVFSVIRFLSFLGWAIVLLGILRSDVSLEEAYQNAPFLFWGGGAAFLLWGALLLYGKLRKKRTEGSKEYAVHLENADRISDDAKQALGIPENADMINVLGERYVMKNGVAKRKNYMMYSYSNLNLYIFNEDDRLCLSNHENAWEIPLSSLHSMTLEKKKLSFEWNKCELPNSERYKKYKIALNEYGVCFAYAYRVVIRDLLGEYYLLIPVYDSDAFIRLTGLRPKAE